ncbi:MAG: hypothetical protein JRJ86_01510 [Deltaproteobacteria bacterium]|nr:hypothetical protein [Deltaproteobacteria bacterium]MBW2116391.1 hypothetical protein [Deltaproteobacteria bacterium]MBW2343089.1 hypothetical protein [Deltaproteobacteria bacterium]
MKKLVLACMVGMFLIVTGCAANKGSTKGESSLIYSQTTEQCEVSLKENPSKISYQLEAWK